MSLSPEALKLVRTTIKQGQQDLAAQVLQANNEQTRADTLRFLGKLLVGAGGAGLAARGATGLYQLRQQHKKPPQVGIPNEVPVEIPMPPTKLGGDIPFGESSDPLAVRPKPKPARKGKPVGQIGSLLQSMAGPKHANVVSDFMSGQDATTGVGVPWAVPAAVLGGGAAAYGGWKGLDHVLAKQRKSRLQQELKETQEEFQQALRESYDQPGEEKLANTTALGPALDQLYAALETLEKQGTLSDVLGAGAGGALTLTGLTTAGAAIAAYHAAKKRRNSNLLRKALSMRDRRQENMQPAAPYAIPAEGAV